MEKQKDQILSAVTDGAKGRLKAAFLLQKIAEKEDIKVSNEELSQRIVRLAQINQGRPERYAKELKKRNGMIEIFDQIMNEKVLDFLQKHARVQDVAAAQIANPTAAP